MNLDQGTCLLKQTSNNRKMKGFSWENNRQEVDTMGDGKACTALEKQGKGFHESGQLIQTYRLQTCN